MQVNELDRRAGSNQFIVAELLLLLQAREFIPSFLICKNLGPQCMLEQCRVKIANPQHSTAEPWRCAV